MNNKLSLTIQNKLSQKLLITPQMKQSLNLLQMPITELLQELNEVIQENPILEEVEPTEIIEEKIKDEFLEAIKNVDWDDFYGHYDDISFIPKDDEDIDFEKFTSRQETLQEHLLFQLNILGLSEEDKQIGEYIIGNLTENGYFRLNIDETIKELNITKNKFINILNLIQEFDPNGIASTNLKECIEKQLTLFNINKYDIELINHILENFEEELLDKNYDKIKNTIDLDDATFNTLLELIRKTDPKPGLKFQQSNRYITPDVYIIKKDNNYEVTLNESELPAIRINTYYMRLLKNKSLDAKTREYVEDKVKNAVWLLKSLNQRQKAILKVVEAIVKIQKDFLDDISNHLKPLKLKDIAEMTDLHESTVSRVTSGKYVQCEHGIFEIKSFFMKALSTDSGNISTTRVKETIKEIIDNEPKDKPLSDQKIVEILQKKGIKIARRTVTKYREELSIPSTTKRRKLRR
jgi:RNA polymerase sigma-54 factor